MSASGGSDTGEQLGEAAAEKVYYASNRSILFLCICLGCSYQCVTEFPYLILSHGGACFLLPYAAVLILLGIPMAAFEMTIGQFRGRGCLELWACVPVGKGIGMAMLLKTFVVTAYKAFYDSCSFYYFLQAFQEDLPWTKCFTWWGASPLNCRERDVDRARACHAEKVRLHQDSVQQAYPPGPNDTWLTVCGQSVRVPFNVYSAALPAECRDPRLHSEYAFFLHGVLKMTRGIDDFGGIRWELLVCYIFTWFVIFVCTAHGVATVGKISPLLGLLPIVVFVAVTAVMLFLPNARSSVFELMYPHWEALYDAGAWSDASYFVLSGLAVGQGQLQALASYSSFDSYTLQWAFLALPLVMTLFNLLSCVLVFGVTGHLAGHLKTCVAEFDTHTYAFPFVIFPEVVKTMSWPKFLSGLFFSSLFALSVDTLVFNVCTVVACAEDLFASARVNINKTVFFVCIGMFLSGFPTVTQAGAYVVKLLEDHTVKAVMAHFVPIIEITVVMYIYGMRRFSFDVEFMLGRAPNIYYRVCWTIICPIGMTLAYAHRVVTYRSPVYFEASVPNEYKALAWIVGCAGLLQIPIGAMACILENIRFPLRAFQPEYQWEPNTVNRVNAYFEEIEERGIQAAEQVSAEVQGVLYDATEALDISFDPNEPLAFQPKV